MTNATSNLEASQTNLHKVVAKKKPILTIQLQTREQKVTRAANSSVLTQVIRAHKPAANSPHPPREEQNQMFRTLTSNAKKKKKEKEKEPVSGERVIRIAMNVREVKIPKKETCKNYFLQTFCQNRRFVFYGSSLN